MGNAASHADPGGLADGVVFSFDAGRPDRGHPRDALRSISALTTGHIAVLVTVVFVHSSLNQARTCSSRLSTAGTILVTADLAGRPVHPQAQAAAPFSC